MNLFSTRRDFLQCSGSFLGALSLASLLNPQLHATPKVAPGKAKRVIQLFMGGGPSHLDTWDCKPGLAKWAGQDMPFSILGANTGNRVMHFDGCIHWC